MSDKPTILKLQKDRGVAGQVAYTVTVQYEGDEEPYTGRFIGSTYGAPGPVVLELSSGMQTFVTDSGQYGSTFDEAWVRRFFGQEDQS